MIKYAKIVDEKTGLCNVGTGTDSKFYESIGMKPVDVTKSETDGCWYLSEKTETDEFKSMIAKEKKYYDNEDIKTQLYELDIKSIRAIRSDEADRLSELEKQAIELRKKLNS